jgi:phosphoribosylaminoimidazolecarboxamide formyltransferase/IMP cyclohydrolase
MAKLALISVSDKRGLGRLAPELERLGWQIISTGGTARALRNAGCEVLEVADYTGFPEILDGRVKTLHPKVFSGILAAPNPEHEKELAEVGIPTLDLVVVNLYPFRETVDRDGVTLDEAVEQIDIGGPSLLRAAAKNHARVTVLVDPEDYPQVLEDLSSGGVDAETRGQLAVKAFRHTAAYDATISAHLPELMGGKRSAAAGVAAELLRCREVELRYGENPHQWGVLARRDLEDGLAGAVQHQGKALSYNNLGDATGAWRLVWDLPKAGVAVIKHANPCGVGLDESMVEAFRKARATDPISAFGGVIASNREVGGAFAEAVVEQFAEVVIAPGYDPSALEFFASKKNLRVLSADPATSGGVVVRDIDGGFVIQEADSGWQQETWEIVTDRGPTAEENPALELAWRVVKHVGSNAIVVGTADRILGIGAGQMSRVDAAKIAVSKALEMGHDLENSVAASDAFFPFPDGVEALYEAGVRAVIQPGGSIRDAEVVEACNRLGMAMVITGRRHFRH